ncbi:hypothetical protein QYM36_001713 [Artemia franciscana]|uniref:Uncharacterized protein n=1 Tax=Artemia franciscana TaxID=6661 RepID=A0AA88I878_ARTSF|nr:hypothetical protein QYM36_001713 [Artemia franciscana]
MNTDQVLAVLRKDIVAKQYKSFCLPSDFLDRLTFTSFLTIIVVNTSPSRLLFGHWVGLLVMSRKTIEVEFPEARIFEETLNMFLFENRTGPDVDLLQATASRTGVTMSSSTAACVSDEEDDRRADPLQALYEGLIDGRLNLQNFCKDQVLKDIKPVFDKQKEELSVDETNSQNLDALLRFGWHKSEFPTRRDSVYGKDICT